MVGFVSLHHSITPPLRFILWHEVRSSEAPSPRQHGEEMPQFIVNILRTGRGLGDFRAQQLAVTLAVPACSRQRPPPAPGSNTRWRTPLRGVMAWRNDCHWLP
jgi:hypothetical protein